MVRAFVATIGEWATIGMLATYGARRGGGRTGVLSDVPDPWDSEYARGGVEPPLEDVLRDPIIQLVMRADRLGPNDVRAASSAARH